MTGTTGVTDGAIDAIMKRAYTTTATETIPSRFKIGKGSTAFSGSQTDLVTPVPIQGTEAVDAFDATTGWVAGTDSAVALNTTTFIEGTGSLSLAKTGTAGTSASMDKTVTSLDFTSKTFVIFVRITDLTDLISSGTAIEIRYGSDSSNYYRLDVGISSLSTGWNIIMFTSATASATVGSPVIAAMDYLRMAYFTDLAADTVAANRILWDDAKLASSDDFFKNYESGFPSVDTGSDEIITESRLTTLQANGVLLSEHGSFNTDGTPVMWHRSTFSGFSKTNTDELIIEERIRVTR